MDDFTLKKLELLCNGIRLPEHILTRFSGYRFKRASLSEGVCFDLFPSGSSQAIPINIAAREAFVCKSPFMYDENKKAIFKNGQHFVQASLVEPPGWYACVLDDGTSFQEVFQVHYHSILAASLTNFCEFKETGRGCRFCALGYQIEKPKIKSVEQVAAVLKELIKQNIYFNEVNLNAGTLLDEKKNCDLYLHIVQCIRKITSVPIYIQICPPKDMSFIDRLIEMGVSSLSFNLEIYDEELRKDSMPGKARISRERYFKAMAHASKLLGAEQISSWLIAGLEPVESTITAIKHIISVGAIPFVTVFRPLIGSEYEKRLPPEPNTLIPIFDALGTSLIHLKYNRQKTKCGCVKCNCCSAFAEVLP
ncbi:MAG: radical SAM protein [Candidatus Omnitrophica bacterium]|nr:radical SAM protein [Candidatus Omnitrophota bacterium]